MYLGRERLGTRKNPVKPFQIFNYSEEDLTRIEQTVKNIKSDYPEFNDVQARIWEVVSRFRGDSGLSIFGVRYLSGAIYEIFSKEES